MNENNNITPGNKPTLLSSSFVCFRCSPPVAVVVIRVVIFAHSVTADGELVRAVLVTVVPRLRCVFAQNGRGAASS